MEQILAPINLQLGNDLMSQEDFVLIVKHIQMIYSVLLKIHDIKTALPKSYSLINKISIDIIHHLEERADNAAIISKQRILYAAHKVLGLDYDAKITAFLSSYIQTTQDKLPEDLLVLLSEISANSANVFTNFIAGLITSVCESPNDNIPNKISVLARLTITPTKDIIQCIATIKCHNESVLYSLFKCISAMKINSTPMPLQDSDQLFAYYSQIKNKHQAKLFATIVINLIHANCIEVKNAITIPTANALILHKILDKQKVELNPIFKDMLAKAIATQFPLYAEFIQDAPNPNLNNAHNEIECLSKLLAKMTLINRSHALIYIISHDINFSDHSNIAKSLLHQKLEVTPDCQKKIQDYALKPDKLLTSIYLLHTIGLYTEVKQLCFNNLPHNNHIFMRMVYLYSQIDKINQKEVAMYLDKLTIDDTTINASPSIAKPMLMTLSQIASKFEITPQLTKIVKSACRLLLNSPSRKNRALCRKLALTLI